MQQGNRIWHGLRKAYARYDQMMEKQGFYVVLVVCVMIIALSALYTFKFRETGGMQEAPQKLEESVAVNRADDQTLEQAKQMVQSQHTLASAPTENPYRFVQPLSGITIRDYSITEPQLFEVARYWRIHPGIDLSADYGTIVSACASGKVMNVWQDHEMGLCVRIGHDLGYETLYAGLSDASYVRAGDQVFQGQTIGHVGDGVLAEGDAGPHLHLEVWRNGSAVDPVKVFLGVER